MTGSMRPDLTSDRYGGLPDWSNSIAKARFDENAATEITAFASGRLRWRSCRSITGGRPGSVRPGPVRRPIQQGSNTGKYVVVQPENSCIETCAIFLQ
jgi:hypothetical protein